MLSRMSSIPLIIVHRLRKSTGDPRYYAPLDRRRMTLAKAIAVSCYLPFSTQSLYMVVLSS